MREFLSKTLALIFLNLVILILLIAATTIICKKKVSLRLPESKNTIVAGDSHTECSIDDKIVPYCANLSQSGTAYFYTYIKLREILSHNPQIDTVVVGYSYDDVSTQKDTWFSGDESIKFKIRNYFFLFNYHDYLDLLQANPKSVLINTPQVIFHNVKIMLYGLSTLGGYLPLEINRLEESIRRHQSEITKETAFSVYQRYYLLKIYELCQSKNIELVLLNPPLYPLLENNQKSLTAEYYNFARTMMSHAILVNHSSINIPDSGFSDLSHLNKHGAIIYSQMLSRSGFGRQ